MTTTLAGEFATATEWNLATLDELLSLKSSSNHRITRQEDICYRMLLVCTRFAPEDIGPPNGRVGRLLAATKSEPEGLRGALSRWVKEHRATFGRR